MYDLLIKNGTIVDGTGAPRFKGDVAVENGLIAKIAPVICEPAKRILDAKGCHAMQVKSVNKSFYDRHE